MRATASLSTEDLCAAQPQDHQRSSHAKHAGAVQNAPILCSATHLSCRKSIGSAHSAPIRCPFAKMVKTSTLRLVHQRAATTAVLRVLIILDGQTTSRKTIQSCRTDFTGEEVPLSGDCSELLPCVEWHCQYNASIRKQEDVQSTSLWQEGCEFSYTNYTGQPFFGDGTDESLLWSCLHKSHWSPEIISDLTLRALDSSQRSLFEVISTAYSTAPWQPRLPVLSFPPGLVPSRVCRNSVHASMLLFSVHDFVPKALYMAQTRWFGSWCHV